MLYEKGKYTTMTMGIIRVTTLALLMMATSIVDVSSHATTDIVKQNENTDVDKGSLLNRKHDVKSPYEPEAGLSLIPDDCLHCICSVLTGCLMPVPVCQLDVGSLSCGPFQIKQGYWSDARLKGGDLMGSWEVCSGDMQCSRDTVQGYMERYAVSSRLGHRPTCEDFTRIHVGGPNGFKSASTVVFWVKVKECLE